MNLRAFVVQDQQQNRVLLFFTIDQNWRIAPENWILLE